MANYDVQRLSEKNIEDMIFLYKVANQQVITKDFLLKKYNTKKWGVEFVGYIAYNEKNLPIAFYGVIPAIIQLDGETILAAQSADTMTHPQYQRQGLFYQLAMKTFELARKEGIRFVFGFASTNSLPGTIKLGFQIMPSNMQLFKIKTGIPSIVTRVRRFGWIKRMHDFYVQRALSRNPVLLINLFQPDTGYGIKHDQSFIDYKTYNKKYCITLGDSRMWLKVDGELKVGFIKIGNENPSAFIKKLKRLAIILGCSQVVFITNKNSSIFKFLSTLFKPREVLPICFQNLTKEPYPFEKIEFEYCDADFF